MDFLPNGPSGPHVSPSRPRPPTAPPLFRARSGQQNRVKQAPQDRSEAATELRAGQLPGLDSDDMASFNQFCMVCERQLTNPATTSLYCSKACRRKDISTASSLQAAYSPLLTPTVTSLWGEAGPLADYDVIPQLSPTQPRPSSLSASPSYSPADESISPFHFWNAPEDGCLDYIGAYPYPPSHRTSSCASSSSAYSTEWAYRPGGPARSSTASEVPSLVSSPSSSLGTTTPCAFGRPLPSKHSKSYSGAFASNKSIDLVTPCLPAVPLNPITDESSKSITSTLNRSAPAPASSSSAARATNDARSRKPPTTDHPTAEKPDLQRRSQQQRAPVFYVSRRRRL